MDHSTRIVPHSQRDRCFRKHHGWVRAKRCGFCERLSHVDEMGVSAPPWRVRGRGARAILTWYCSTQCAQSLDTSRAGWRHRAPFVYPADFTIPDIDPAWMHPVDPGSDSDGGPDYDKDVDRSMPLREVRRILSMSSLSEGEPAMPLAMAMQTGERWADDGEDDAQPSAIDIKFGSF